MYPEEKIDIHFSKKNNNKWISHVTEKQRKLTICGKSI